MLRRIRKLRERWAPISRELDDSVVAMTVAQLGAPPGYRETLQLARLILVGSATDPTSDMGGHAFSFFLASLWERALRRMFDQLAELSPWHRVADEQCTRQWDDSSGLDDPNRWLTADTIVERAGARWVLDTKYKCDFGNESRADRFQMCAYALAFDADRVSLVYPTGAKCPSVRILLATTVGVKRVVIDSIALPMACGPEACVSALGEVIGADSGRAAWNPLPAPTVWANRIDVTLD
jgi:hypothetical protein